MSVDSNVSATRSHAATDFGSNVLSDPWNCIIQFARVLWVVRVPLSTTILGLLLLGMTPQAQDLFVEFSRAPTWRMFLFLFVFIAVWAVPTHYAARLLIDTDARLQKSLATAGATKRFGCLRSSSLWVPRILGLLTFVAVLIAILRSYLNLPNLDQKEVIAAVGLSLIEMALLVIAGAVGFVFYLIYRPRHIDLPVVRAIKRHNSRLWRLISLGVAGVGKEADEENRDLGRLLLLGIFIIFLSIFAFGADVAGRLFPRAMAVPFILGGWLPFLAYLSAVGRAVRAPLIVGLFVLISAFVVLLGDNHSVRLINAASRVGHSVDVSPLPLQDAVKTWMQENNCDGSNCPRPIIVAASGGASRGGFFTATVIGYFMQEANSHGLDPNQVRKRLFAISSVSGGSMGAVMVTAALNAKNDSSDHPCIQSPVKLWWGETINNWRDCLEALTSGDFLTADFFGFAFNDMLPFGWWRDRAAVLEDTWNHRYRATVTRADPPPSPSKCEGLDCPFLTLRPRPGHWIPLLVLNGTSEATGGRIITTILDSTYRPQTHCPTAEVQSNCQLFVEAERFHDLLAYEAKADGWFSWLGGFERWLLSGKKVDDIRLSTAAHNSARFPIISPPGSVRNQDQTIVDRIVDGGYFENYGALGAKELALAVNAVEPKLAPVVIVISNDPNDLLDPSDDSTAPDVKGQLQARLRQQVQKARALVNGSEPVTDIVTPLTTSENARTAHGLLGVAELHSALHEAIPNCDASIIQIRVWPQFDSNSNVSKEVSMSWWLSTPIQRHLHQQTEGVKDGNQNQAHLEAIWTLMRTTTDCAANQYDRQSVRSH
jgi:hypothetical protein